MSEINHIREDLKSLRDEIRTLTAQVSKYMQTTESSISRLSTLSDGYSKQITELWRHMNELHDRQDELSNRLNALEGASMGTGKLIALLAAVASAAAALITLLR